MSEGHANTGPEHRLERLVFFSDAVFAIAITLLVIELHPPHLTAGASIREQLIALVNQLPGFSGFVISFFVIGAFWAGHHRAFALAARWSDGLILPSLFLLLTMAAMPYFTALSSANPFGRVAQIAYCAWLMLAGVCNVRLQRLVTRSPVIDPAAAPEAVAMIRRRGLAVVAGAATALVAAALLPFPSLGLMGLASIGLWRRLFGRWGVA